ncbi:hypothetical protein [Nonomuraea sp. KM90]|uniref:hypothetical protein n=1 Tax=Nonomuraea sp. KM90 TaxID=3457428 RepID=UPI003FCD8F7C
MISRLPRIVYGPLPAGQDWSIARENDERIIIINEALDNGDRKAARRAALAATRQGPLAWLPVPVLLGINWTERQVRGPFGSAAIASTMTVGALYGVGQLRNGEQPLAEPPPSVVTVHVTPTADPTTPPPSARPTRTRPPETRAGDRGDTTAQPTRPAPTGSPPRGDPAPTQRPSRTPPAPDPTTPGSAAEEAEEPTPTPPTTADDPPTTQAETEETETPAATEDPPQPAATEAACGGIGLDADLGGLGDLDLCLLG